METCVGCGKVIPEGTQVCPICVDITVRAAGNKIREHLCEEPIQKKKVKMFYGHLGAFSDDLESRINYFIKHKNVTDIQYRLSDGKHSVMIVYEEVN